MHFCMFEWGDQCQNERKILDKKTLTNWDVHIAWGVCGGRTHTLPGPCSYLASVSVQAFSQPGYEDTSAPGNGVVVYVGTDVRRESSARVGVLRHDPHLSTFDLKNGRCARVSRLLFSVF